MFKLFNMKKEPTKVVDETTVVELANGKTVPLKSMVEVVTNAMEEEEEKNQKANMEDFVEVAGESMSVKNLVEKYESAMCKDNSEDEGEKENLEEEEDKENEIGDEYEDGDKENSEDEEEESKENSEDEDEEDKENAEDEEEDEKENSEDEEKKDYFNSMKNSIANGKGFSLENSSYETLSDKVARGQSRY
jgi:hypothetical protein